MFIFLNRAFFVPHPLVVSTALQQHLNANRRSVAPRRRPNTPYPQWRPRFRPFRHFSRNFNVQREFQSSTLRPLSAFHMHPMHGERLPSHGCTRTAGLAATASPKSLADTHVFAMCLLLRHGMFACPLIHVRFYPLSPPGGVIRRQPRDLNARTSSLHSSIEQSLPRS